MSRVFACLLACCVLLAVPLTAQADFMRVTLLGTGSPRIDTDRAGPSVLVEAGGKVLLFDAGRSVVPRLAQLGMHIAKIDTVFLTHLHSDHIFGLDDLWITGWVYQRPLPLTVYGPAGTSSFTRGLEQAFAYDIAVRNQYAGLDKNAIRLVTHEIEPGVVYSNDRVRVTAFLVDHGVVTPAYGYRIDFGDRSVVISGDTSYSETLVEQARGTDLLIHELFAARADLLEKNPRLRRIERYHTNPEQMVRILKETRPRFAVTTHVILAGLRPDEVIRSLRERYTGEIHMGEDLMQFEIGGQVRMLRFEDIRQ
ncbi:MAG: MBL fold metallo-hydrolase [Proteobacteria bacterium]|nr:MBL fold metallo-hydrolase [Pseudomonadota bacterium]